MKAGLSKLQMRKTTVTGTRLAIEHQEKAVSILDQYKDVSNLQAAVANNTARLEKDSPILDDCQAR